MTNKQMKKLLIDTLKISEEFMYFGLLEMSAWMGIPEKKREQQVQEILSNYQYKIEETIKKLK
jgi:hypothetical protein